MIKKQLLEKIRHLLKVDLGADKNRLVDKCLLQKMVDAGFDPEIAHTILGWFADSVVKQEIMSSMNGQKYSSSSIRVYGADECEKIGIKARHYLAYLERRGIIDATLREQVIYLALKMEVSLIRVRHIKKLVLTLLFQDPAYEHNQLRWLAILLLGSYDHTRH